MITIGTDCSGIEAPIQALRQLKIPHRHIFSSEIDKKAKASLLANYNPEIFYDSIFEPRVLQQVDVYVAGFPCQPFSKLGLRKGLKDDRINVFYAVVDTIKKCCKKMFILENVKELLKYKHIFEFLTAELVEFDISWKILNSRHYGVNYAVPQNRERLYIIGMKKPLKFIWPKEIDYCKPIEEFIDYSCTEQIEYSECYKKREHLFGSSVFVIPSYLRLDTCVRNQNYCPTLSKNNILLCHKLRRKATIKEYLLLQDFDPSFIQVVSKSNLIGQIGNSMAVNVLKALFIQAIANLKKN